MLTKRWIIVLAITGVLATMTTVGAVLARDNGSEGDPSRQSLASRVATILGLEEGVVQEALAQARRDIGDERFQKRLDRLVAQGRLDQEQADELRNWYESRPDYAAGAFFGSRKSGGGHSLHGRGSFGRHGISQWGRFGQYHAIPEAPPSDSGGTSY